MISTRLQICLDACSACADACDFCAAACLQEAAPQELARCILIDNDCAQMCRMTAGALARNSEFGEAICLICADLCDACASECERHAMQHCQDCAIACRHCAEQCRVFAQTAPQPAYQAGPGASVLQ